MRETSAIPWLSKQGCARCCRTYPDRGNFAGASRAEIVKKIDPDAYEDYLKGRYFCSKRTADGLKKAVDYFNQAIAKDPNYAAPYSGLADTFALLGDWQYAVMPTKKAVPKAKAAALKALELDDTLGEAHHPLTIGMPGTLPC